MRLEMGSSRSPAAWVLMFGLCLAPPGVALADGGGGGGNSPGPSCRQGEVWSDRTGRCERQQASVLTDGDRAQYAIVLAKARRYDEAFDVLNTMRNRDDAMTLLPDADLAEYAIVLAKAKRYADALAVLNKMKNPNSAVALNYRGYVTRHLGRLDEGIGYYLKAVKLDPRYAQVREYLGEAYVIKGDLPRAKVQLAMIRSICGNVACEEYEDLSKAIAGKGIEE